MKDFILELPNFVPDNFCNHLINKFEADTRKGPGITTIEDKPFIIPEIKNSTELVFSNLNDWVDEDKQVYNYISKSVKEYYKYIKKNFDYNDTVHPFERLLWLPVSDFGYTIHKQEQGARYAWHYDWNSRTPCFVVLMIYLNTLQPDQGGKTIFSNGREVTPECGKIVIFPASWTYPHSGGLVKYGNKYILTVELFL